MQVEEQQQIQEEVQLHEHSQEKEQVMEQVMEHVMEREPEKEQEVQAPGFRASLRRSRSFTCSGAETSEERIESLETKVMLMEKKQQVMMMQIQELQRRNQTIPADETVRVETEDTEEEARYPCNVCGKYFDKVYSKERHTKVMHTLLVEQEVCSKPWCDASFDTKYEVKVHVAECTYVCGELNCTNQAIKSRILWKKHKQMHEAQKLLEIRALGAQHLERLEEDQEQTQEGEGYREVHTPSPAHQHLPEYQLPSPELQHLSEYQLPSPEFQHQHQLPSPELQHLPEYQLPSP